MTTTDFDHEDAALSETRKRLDEISQDVNCAADAAGRSDLADRLKSEWELASGTLPTTLLVAGETKRGKSSLINALLHRNELLPVDPDVATAVPILVSFGQDEALVFSESTDAPRHIPLSEVGDFASTLGNPGNEKQVARVEITVPAALLKPGLRIVDTPGVGGLDPAHGQVTLTQLRGADAMLFVLEASDPISLPEREFVEEARQRVETILFALAKADKPNWAEIEKEDRRLMMEVREELANIKLLPVSAKTAALADKIAAQGDADTAEVLWASSGMQGLEDAIKQQVIGRKEWLRLANLARLAGFTLGQIEQWHRQVLAQAANDAHAGDDLRERRARLQQRQAAAGSWQRDYGDSLSILDTELRKMLVREEQEMRVRLTKMIDGWARGASQTIPESFDAEIKAATLRIQGRLVEESSRITGEMAARLEVAPDDIAVAVGTLEQAVTSEVESIHIGNLTGSSKTQAEVRTGMAVFWGGSLGTIVAGMFGLFGLILPPAAPLLIGLAAGVFNAGLTKRALEMSHSQGEARTQVDAGLTIWTNDLGAGIESELRRVQAEASNRLQVLIRDRLIQLNSEEQELRKQMAQVQESGAERERHEKAIEGVLHEQTKVVEVLESIRRQAG